MKHRIFYLLPFLLPALLCVGVAWARKPADTVPDKLSELKAEYIFLEATNARNEDKYDDYYMLLRQAHKLSPSDPYILASLAEIEIVLPGIDSLRQEELYRAIAERFRLEPTNQRYAAVYANLAQQARRIDDIIEIWTLQDSLRPDRSDPAFNLAAAYTARFGMAGDSTDLDRALAIYERLERGMGHTLPVAGRKVNIYFAQGDTAAVLRELDGLEADAPRDIDTKLFVGSVYDHIGLTDSALARYDRAAAIDPDNGKIYLVRASYFREQGDSVGYDTEVFRALESRTLDFEPKFELLTDYVSKLYTDSLQWPRIDRMFSLMEEQNPGEASFHALLAGYMAARNEPEAAAEQLSYSIDLDPSDNSRWVNLVQLYLELDDTTKVDATARRAMQLFPDEGYYPLIISSMLMGRGQDTTALAMIDTLDIRSYKNDKVASAILSTKGDILWRLGRSAQATDVYREAILLNPENYMAMNNFAYFCACEEIELNAAQLYASIASTADPENLSFIDTYAWVFFVKKDYARAKETIDKALELLKTDDDPSTDTLAEIYEHAGDIYFLSGLTDQAITFWKDAQKVRPSELLKMKIDNKTYLKQAK